MADLFDQSLPPASPRRGAKSAEAFRTISEVAGDLEVPQHVLRFWESKFPQVRPLKRAGGRRYYRPDDVRLLRRIRQCLYDQGYTIKGVQKLLREGGLKPEAHGMAAPAPPPPQPAADPRRSKPQVSEDLRAVLIEMRQELAAIRDQLAKLAR